MHVSHIVVAATVTLSVSAVCYSQFDSRKAEQQARAVADKATCRAVDSAILAYVGVHGGAPSSVSQLTGYLDGDITAYRVVRGRAAGPGCASGAR
ncbi:hypothetical protein OWR29_16440 [Actinoplanes sp. Pm04-4]|uniref:Type II secretion system protein n=1 Tax=Paractinoplanes pyxinae TaxID=2997416 RepID=A0ABT4AZG4_9ACTN|nr:hypothetical protein [Actinoplanes pyxinae]MCY1139589.1 hypothetical protein [Actinoplanes pyxinae]